MAGGLIQIVSYGSQDLYLTGTPEITFFKVVYRRHTNFATESIQVPFDDPVGFGKKASLTVPRVGDLIHKTYLEIILPQMSLKRFNTSNGLIPEVQTALANYETTTAFMSVNRKAYVDAYDVFIAQNTIDSSKLIRAVNDVFDDPANQDTITAFEELMAATPEAPFPFSEVSLGSVVDRFGPADDKNVVFNALTVAIDKSIKTQKFFFNTYKDLRNQLADDLDPNLKFAWVERVGHAIIEQIEVKIGGYTIDRHFGDWLNVWYELSANRSMQDTYYQLIGNVNILTTFNRVVKPRYALRIPLQFWFCRFSGLAIPLVAMEYHDVTFEVKFRNIEEVSYIEFGQTIKFNNTTDGLKLDEFPQQTGIDIEATMLIDYVYLDSSERKRFAQSSHEYLIEQLQILELRDITINQIQVVLNNFVHPVKELIWLAQQTKYTVNPDGFTQTRFDNYSLTDQNEGNIVRFTSMNFHSYTRVPRLDGNYYNYLQPYENHNTTPSDGINVYAFAAFPEEFQPSGAANMTRLSRVLLNLEFDPSLFDSIVPNTPIEPLIVRIYAKNLNILRISNGFGAVIFAYG
jgi:hypothetical protein